MRKPSKTFATRLLPGSPLEQQILRGRQLLLCTSRHRCAGVTALWGAQHLPLFSSSSPRVKVWLTAWNTSGSSEHLATRLEMGSQPAGAGHKLVAHLGFATNPWRCRKGALPVIPPKHDPPPQPWLRPPLRVAARSWGHDAGCPVSGWQAIQGADLRGMLRSARRAAQGRLSAPSRGSASAAPCVKHDEIQRYLQARGEVTVQKGPSAVPEEIPSIWFNRALVNVEVFLSQCSL